MGEAKRRKEAALSRSRASGSSEEEKRLFKLTSNPTMHMKVETSEEEPEDLAHLMENVTGVAPYINVEGTFTGERASLEEWVCRMTYGYAINFRGDDTYIISRMLDNEDPTDTTVIEHLLRVLRERVDSDFASDGKAPPMRTGAVKLIGAPSAKNKIQAYAATATNNQKWEMMVEAARLTKQSLKLVIEFDEDSEHPGRRMELAYDPVNDKQSWKWLDEC